MSKVCKKGYIEITKKISLDTLKNVLGRSILHYWIELPMLLRCCLVHINIMILRHILYLLYLGASLGLGLCLFMLHFCDQFFIFSFIFIAINHIASLKQTQLLFVHFLEYLLFLDDNKEGNNKEENNIQKAKRNFW